MRNCVAVALTCLLASAGPASARTVLGQDVSSIPAGHAEREVCTVVDDCLDIAFGPGAVAWDGTNLWVGGGLGNPTVYKFDVETCTAVSSFPTPSGGSVEAISGLAWDGEYLWCHPEETGMIYKFDPDDGSIVHSFEAPSYGAFDPNGGGLAWDGEHLWHVDSENYTIFKLDPTDGTVLDSFPAPEGYTGDLGWSEGKLIVADIVTDAVYVLDSTDGTVLQSCDAPTSHTWGIAETGAGVWTSGYFASDLHMLDLFGTPVESASWGTVKSLYR